MKKGTKSKASAKKSYMPRITANLLILRGANLCKQGVAGSNPVTSTKFLICQ